MEIVESADAAQGPAAADASCARANGSEVPLAPGEVTNALIEEVRQWKRSTCSTCSNSAMFYCCFCCKPAGVPEGVEVPVVRLPFGQCDVIFADAPKKATGIHAKVLAPDQVRLVDLFTKDDHSNRTLSRGVSGSSSCAPTATVRDMPQYDIARTFVLYPDDQSITVSDLRELDVPLEELTLVLIDSPWKRSQALRQSPGLAELRSVRLTKPPTSQFWRYHDEGGECVSSIETLALVCAELDPRGSQDSQRPAVEEEPLLYLFSRQLAQIRLHCGDGAELPSDPAAKRRRQEKVRQKDRPRKQLGLAVGASDGGGECVGSQ